MRRVRVGLVIAGLAAATAATAQAQFRFGAQVNWASETDLGIGARANFSIGEVSRRRPVEGQITLDFFFPDGADYWELTGDVLYRFDRTESIANTAPYVGAGLIFAHTTPDNLSPGLDGRSDLGLNLAAGLRLQSWGTTLPFVEVRFEFVDESQLVLTAGLLFGRP